MKQEKSCGAILYYLENKEILYLLIQYELNHNYWGFVKGHVEYGESEIETAIREIREEVNLEDLSFVNGFRLEHFYQSNPFTNKQVVFFLAMSPTKNVLLNPTEVKNSLWLSFSDAIKKLTYENDREILATANEKLKQVNQI